MVKRTVAWTETAVRQRRSLLKYWTKRNGSTHYAESIIKSTKDRIKIILTNPRSSRLSEYPETRVAAMGHFSIFYKVTPAQIIITAFWDNRQDPEKILELLKKER
jgi:plasmid stabilization system protein ParE